MVPAVRHNIVFVVFIFAHFLASASRGSRRRTFSLAGQRRGGRKVCSRVIFFRGECDRGPQLSVARPAQTCGQPGQRHFQLNMIIGNINRSRSQLTKGADAKRHPVTRPRLLLHHEHGKTGGGLAQRLIRRKASSLPSLCGSLTTRGSVIGAKSHSTSSRERPARTQSPRLRPR